MSAIAEFAKYLPGSNHCLEPQQRETTQQERNSCFYDRQLALIELQVQLDNLKTINDLFSNKKIG